MSRCLTSIKKNYLGYLLVTPEMGSEGYGGYYDFMVCEGESPTEVIVDYFTKLGKSDEYKPKYVNIKPDGTFTYHDYFTMYFIELPGEDVYMPDLLNIIKSDDPIKFRVGDHVYFTKTEQELRCPGCHFKAEKTSIPITRKIVSITMTEDGIRYQISGCGMHFENKDIDKFVFSTYKDAKNMIDTEKGV